MLTMEIITTTGVALVSFHFQDDGLVRANVNGWPGIEVYGRDQQDAERKIRARLRDCVDVDAA